jgi:hypothetical protein
LGWEVDLVRDRPLAAVVSRGTQVVSDLATDLGLPKRDGCWA